MSVLQYGDKTLGFHLHTYFKPPSSRISFVLKLVWQPAPFQFPGMGLGSKEATMPKSSQTLCRMKRAIHKWSPILIPSQGPTWNSHWRTRQLQQLVFWKFITLHCTLQCIYAHTHTHTQGKSHRNNLNKKKILKVPIHKTLPVQAWLQHWCHIFVPQHTDRLYNGLLQHPVHRPYQLPHHSSMDLIKEIVLISLNRSLPFKNLVGDIYLEVQGSHWKANQMDDHLCREECTPAPFQTKDAGSAPYPWPCYTSDEGWFLKEKQETMQRSIFKSYRISHFCANCGEII